MQLYEYAVVLNEKLDKDGEVVEPAKLIIDKTTILARDEKQAGMVAARAIPAEYDEKLDRLTVVLRPF